MASHYTPESVAKALAKHAPSKSIRILEPSVGKGDLILPFLEKNKKTLKDLVCVDINRNVLDAVKKKVTSLLKTISLDCVHSNFLEWSNSVMESDLENYFDCIIMNPPFSGRNESLVKININSAKTDLGEECRSVPVEIAFIVKSLPFLRPGGRLLAVVPCSAVSSIKTSWFRNHMIQIGSIDYVHELPKHTFKGVESRVYLMVYTKSKKQQNVILRNHDLSKPISMLINKGDLINYPRFDYNYQQARLSLLSVINSIPKLNWVKLNDISNIIRGTIKSPIKNRNIFHTHHFQNGFWIANKGNHRIRNSEASIRTSDLLIKRVSRNCVKSIGIVVDHRNNYCSDCLLIIRSINKKNSKRLLFALRTIYSDNLGRKLLERGTGATYIVGNDLCNLKVPMNLNKSFPKSYDRYRTAISMRDIHTMKRIEKDVRKELNI